MIDLTRPQKVLQYRRLSEVRSQDLLTRGVFEDNTSWQEHLNEIGTVVIGTAVFDMSRADPEGGHYPLRLTLDRNVPGCNVSSVVPEINVGHFFPDTFTLDISPDQARAIYGAGQILITARVVYKKNKRYWGLDHFRLQNSIWHSDNFIDLEIARRRRGQEQQQAEQETRQREQETRELIHRLIVAASNIGIIIAVLAIIYFFHTVILWTIGVIAVIVLVVMLIRWINDNC